jgi:tRNA pseudouridine55 synthase
VVEETRKGFDFQKGEVLLFDKDINWTSFDLVQRIRNTICKRLGIKKLKVGHAGTLDPLATGLLILCTGKATKKIESFQEQEKEYIAQLKLGATTPSFDMETEEENQIPFDHITRILFEATLNRFLGKTEQVPPLFSAIKVNGKRAFDYARKGKELELKPKPIEIKEINIESFDPPFTTIRIVCSKGTYIRSLARDIGDALNCGAYLTGLRRTRIGEFSVNKAHTINGFIENIDRYITK